MELHSSKYDLFEPRPGHEKRFEKKLKKTFASNKVSIGYKKWMIAASVALLMGLGSLNFMKRSTSPEQIIIEKNTAYFSSIIQEEVKSLKEINDPQAGKLIANTMNQLKKLEKEYDKIIKDYKKNNENKNLLNAMIDNFKKRIELIEFAKFQLKEIQKLKASKNEQNKA